jgi:hypothetical protein
MPPRGRNDPSGGILATFVRQPQKSYNCGPIAILNALKWSGMKVRKRDAVPFLDFSCRLDQDEDDPGTEDGDLDRTLRYAAKGRLDVRRPKRLSVRNLRTHIQAGGAALVGYFHTSGGGHYTLLVKAEGRRFLAANDTKATLRRTMSYKRRKTVHDWLHRPGTAVWLLARSGDNKRDGEKTAAQSVSIPKTSSKRVPRAHPGIT